MNVNAIGINQTIGLANDYKKVSDMQDFQKHIQEAQLNQSKMDEKTLDEEQEELMDACKEIETYFLTQVFKGMTSAMSLDKDKNQVEKLASESLINNYAKMATNRGGIGMADQLFEQMDYERFDPKTDVLD